MKLIAINITGKGMYDLPSDSSMHLRHRTQRRCSMKKAFLKNFVTFTEKHLCWSLILRKLQALERHSFCIVSSEVHVFRRTYASGCIKTSGNQEISENAPKFKEKTIKHRKLTSWICAAHLVSSYKYWSFSDIFHILFHIFFIFQFFL